jgi:hypothetical protein
MALPNDIFAKVRQDFSGGEMSPVIEILRQEVSLVVQHTRSSGSARSGPVARLRQALTVGAGQCRNLTATKLRNFAGQSLPVVLYCR